MSPRIDHRDPRETLTPLLAVARLARVGLAECERARRRDGAGPWKLPNQIEEFIDGLELLGAIDADHRPRVEAQP